MLAGSFVVSHITSPVATWIALVLLLAVHLATNYKAVSCVAMRTLNRQRTNIVFSWFQETGIVLTPKEVSKRERVLEKSGVLRWGNSVIGFANVGVRFATVLISLIEGDGTTGSFDHDASGSRRIQELASIFHKEKYLLWPTTTGRRGSSSSLPRVYICLKTGASANDQVRAWSHALNVAKEFSRRRSRGENDGYYERIGLVQATMDEMGKKFADVAKRLAEKGWDLDTACIETRSGFRVAVLDGGKSYAVSSTDLRDKPVTDGVVSTTASDTAYREDKKVV
ncbi:hypothetical protein K440DRAFT_634152 [Wilcoxina mikolae CBS 423.85]|nr:hypothetical protein K440DRAFT_634152 [Wilcoxina mikolae CBS 423.85]